MGWEYDVHRGHKGVLKLTETELIVAQNVREWWHVVMNSQNLYRVKSASVTILTRELHHKFVTSNSDTTINLTLIVRQTVR